MYDLCCSFVYGVILSVSRLDTFTGGILGVILVGLRQIIASLQVQSR